MPETPDPLDPLINRWKSDELLPRESLHAEVWRRIADAEAHSTSGGWWGHIDAIFARPSFNFAFIAACTLFGLFLAELRLSRLQAQRNIQLAQAYVRLIDPLIEKSSAAPATPTKPSPL